LRRTVAAGGILAALLGAGPTIENAAAARGAKVPLVAHCDSALNAVAGAAFGMNQAIGSGDAKGAEFWAGQLARFGADWARNCRNLRRD
jgi:hypothetical protein